MSRALVRQREAQLREAVRSLHSVVVAFSGGVDSAVVLAAAARALGENVLAVTASSPSVASGELDGAARLAHSLGVRHTVIETREFDDPNYRANPANRCYYCKHELYMRLVKLATDGGFAYVVDGCNADDGSAPLDRRPGRAAAAQHGVVSPLAQCGITKEMVRQIAALYGLPVWNKPATPCLSSRVPYGMRIEIDDLRRIDLAERYLRAGGFETVRVRHYGAAARIEVPAQDVPRLQAVIERVGRALSSVGYETVEVDPRGYRTGSLNETAKER